MGAAGADRARAPRRPAGVSRAVLHGREAPGHGDVLRAVGPAGAVLLLAAGTRPKRYVPVDPNEDGVAAVATPGGIGLVVVDGHRGAVAAEHALPAAVAALAAGTDPAGAVLAAHRAAAAARTAAGSTSRTTVLVAVAAADVLRWASVGDSLLLCDAVLLNPLEHRFAGDPDDPPVVHAGAAPLPPGATVTLCSDGLTDAIADPTAAVRALLGRTPVALADALHDAAEAAGMRDNLACAVWRA